MSEFFAALMTFCFVWCNIPQMRQMIKTKSTKDINLNSCFIACVGNIFGILSYLTAKDLPLMLLINNIIFTALSIAILWLRLKYK